MYRRHFGLKRAPFSIAPDPRYLYMSRQHKEALAHLLYGIKSEGGFVLLTGEIGAGKTTICRRLLETLSKNIVVAYIINPTVSAGELPAAICDEFSISYRRKASTKELVDRINAFLLELNAMRKKAILIIDEAQNLRDEVLEQIRLLTNLETNERKLLQIILIGQPELRERLGEPQLKQLSQRIVARCHIEALSKPEVIGYVKHRIAVARGTARGRREPVPEGEHALFSKSALESLYHLSGGIPRLINLICDRSLLGAFVQQKQTVDKKTLEKAAREVLGSLPPRAGRKWRIGLSAAALVCLWLFSIYVLFNGFTFAGKYGLFKAKAQPSRLAGSKAKPAEPVEHRK
jgi:general secretion pathway protein A